MLASSSPLVPVPTVVSVSVLLTTTEDVSELLVGKAVVVGVSGLVVELVVSGLVVKTPVSPSVVVITVEASG